MLILLVLAYIGARNWMKPISIDKTCPDKKVIDYMPAPLPAFTEYYIVNEKKVEIDAYLESWVETNCKVPVEEIHR